MWVEPIKSERPRDGKKKIKDVKDRGMGQKRGEETSGRVLGEIRNVGWGKKERGSTKAHCFEMPE